MAQSDPVLFTVDNRVALITVNDPDRRNAVTAEMSARLRAAVERAEADPDVHAVVVTGAGKAFCAGADLSALGAAGGDTETGLQRLYDGFMAVGSCTLPTIAAVNGAAVGAGLNLALAADVRIAGPAALFDARFQKLGLHPGGGATWMLQRAVGPQVARAALLFGMRFDAEAAVRHGLALRSPTIRSPRRWSWPPGPRPPPRGRAGDQGHHARHRQPGIARHEQHDLAMRTELGPQAASIQSPEFAAATGRGATPVAKRQPDPSQPEQGGLGRLDQLPQLAEELRHLGAVGDAVVEHARQRHRRAHHDLVADGHRARLDRPHAQDRRLGMVDHRHPVVRTERPEVRHGERRAAQLGGRQRALARTGDQFGCPAGQFAGGLAPARR